MEVCGSGSLFKVLKGWSVSALPWGPAFLFLVFLFRGSTTQKEERRLERNVVSANASWGTVRNILSPTASLLLLLIFFHYQMVPQLRQLEFKAASLNQSVSLVGFLKS